MSSNNRISEYNAEESKLSVQSESFFNLLADRGVIFDKRIESEQIRKAKRNRALNCYHNTLILMENYRDIAWLLEYFPDEIAEELDRPFLSLDRLAEKIDVETSFGNKKIENRVSCIMQTRLLMDRVNEALTVLQKKPRNGKKLYNVLWETYISKEELSKNEILSKLDISLRSYYRYREQALNIISIRLWSSPDASIDFWFELLTLIEGMNA